MIFSCYAGCAHPFHSTEMAVETENHSALFKTLRLSELEAKKVARHYNNPYRKECVKNTYLRKEIQKLKKYLQKSQKKCERLIVRLFSVTNEGSNEFVHKGKLSRKRKSWTQAKCDRTKRQRLSEYKHVLFDTIQKNVPQCRRAQLGLWLDGKSVNYCWKGKDFQKSKSSRSAGKPFNFAPRSDHSYACSKLIDYDSEDDEDFADIDYASIFDADGNWQQKHKRSIIHIMDSYCISHEAYHELRHAGKNHFPPLHQIRIEKILMSAEIPYM